MFLDSHRRVLTFRRWLDLLDVVAFWIPILKLFTILQNYWHRVSDIISFEKHLESCLGDTQSICPNLVNFCFKNVFRSEGISRQVFYDDLVYTLKRVKGAANCVSSGSKIVKRHRHQKYDQVIIERTTCLVLGPSTVLRRQGPDPRPLRLLGLLQILDLVSLTTWAKHSLLWRISLYIR